MLNKSNHSLYRLICGWSSCLFWVVATASPIYAAPEVTKVHKSQWASHQRNLLKCASGNEWTLKRKLMQMHAVMLKRTCVKGVWGYGINKQWWASIDHTRIIYATEWMQEWVHALLHMFICCYITKWNMYSLSCCSANTLLSHKLMLIYLCLTLLASS